MSPSNRQPARGERGNLYQEVTDKIVSELEQGRVPWVQPWGSASAGLGLPKNGATARRYSGINVLVLWGAVIEKGYRGQNWLTFRQALTLGGSVRKGEKGTTVFYANTYIPKGEVERAAKDGDGPNAVPFLSEAYLEAGWREVVILDKGQQFQSWQCEKTTKKNGGKVFIAVSPRGEVTFHEGYVSREEAKRKAKEAAKVAASEGRDGEARPEASAEVTGALQTYLDFHRHAAARAVLLDDAGVALRLMVAHAIGGSRLWKVCAEPQRSGRDETDSSIAASRAQKLFEKRKVEALAFLELPEGASLAGGHAGATAATFARLIHLSDAKVMKVLAAAMADSLEAGSALVEAVGVHLKVDVGQWWTADDSFFDLIRDKAVLTAMIAEVGGKTVANGNIAATGKVQKQIVRDFLDGTNGRQKVASWLPRWLRFPAEGYRKNGGFAPVAHWKAIKRHFAK